MKKGRKMKNCRCLMVVVILLVASLSVCLAEDNAANSMRELQELVKKAQVASESQNYAEAISLLERVLKKIPNNPILEYNLACAYAQSGKKDEALAHLEKAVSFGFIDTDHIDNDQDLASIKESPKYAAILEKAKKACETHKKLVANVPDPKSIFHQAEGIKKGQKSPLLIFLHGMGSSPKEFESTVLPLVKSRQYSVLLPCGSVKMGMRPDGKPAYNWDANRDIAKIVEEIKNLEAIQPGQVYLAGFSAGASMCYFVALKEPERFAGVIAFSGALQKEFVPGGDGEPANKKVPMFIVHGKQDAMMPFVLAENAEAYFKKNGFRVVLRSFDGGHTLPKNYFDLLKEAVEWFKKQPMETGGSTTISAAL